MGLMFNIHSVDKLRKSEYCGVRLIKMKVETKGEYN